MVQRKGSACIGFYSIISFEGTRLLGEPGKATLPFYPVKLLIPPGEIATDIRIKFEKPLTIQGPFDLLPRQRPRPISEEKEEEWLIDDEFYQSTVTYPSSQKINTCLNLIRWLVFTNHGVYHPAIQGILFMTVMQPGQKLI